MILMTEINAQQILGLLGNCFDMIDPRLVGHELRTAGYADQLLAAAGVSDEQRRDLDCLAFLHDIGAYKTEEIARMIQFETETCWDHSIYGLLFLHHYSPFSTWAEAVLYHHSRWDQMIAAGINKQIAEAANLISFCDRLDIFTTYGAGSIEDFLNRAQAPENQGRYAPAIIELAVKTGLQPLSMMPKDFLFQAERRFPFTQKQVETLLMMLIVIIDFRSRHTVTHTMITASTAVQLGQRCGLQDAELMTLKIAGLFHDLGKIGIPLEILENPGRLSAEEMAIMKTHVEKTAVILNGWVSQKICDIALRHHEKLNGTGYPAQLSAEQLTLPQRILAVADIFSALTGERSYKQAYTLERSCRILAEMRDAGQLDAQVVNALTHDPQGIAEINEQNCREITDSYQRIQVENQILHTCLKEEASAEKCLNQQWHRINAWISDKADQCEMNS